MDNLRRGDGRLSGLRTMLRRCEKKWLLCGNAIDEVRCCGIGPRNDRRASVDEKRAREGILCTLPKRSGEIRNKSLGLKSVRPLVDFCLTGYGDLSLDHGTLGSKRICQAGALEKDKIFPPAFRDDPSHQKPDPLKALPRPSTVLLFVSACVRCLFNKIVVSLELCNEGVQKIGASQNRVV